MRDEQHEGFQTEVNQITDLVREIFEIKSMIRGGEKQGYRLKYVGHLALLDSEAAYDRLAASLDRYNLIPLFREEENAQSIIIVEKRPEAKLGPVWVNVVLLVLTIISVMFTGAQFSSAEVSNPFTSPGGFFAFLLKGWPFAVSLLGILLAHEMGHYLVGRARGEKVTLPYFIPFPLSAFGTMGAFISMKQTPRNKKHLMDIGIAGPLAGLVVAIPVLLIGLSLSEIGPIEGNLPEGYVHMIEGNSLFYLLAKYLTFGKLLPAPANYGGMLPFIYWLRYFFTGSPLPLGGTDVHIHSVAWAGWAGLFVTAINLIPAGQLDGGHVLYVLLGKQKAKRIFPFIIGGLLVLGFFWQVWWVWAALIFFLGRHFAEPLDMITPVDRKRKLLGILMLVIIILIFIPVPLIINQ